MWCGCKKGSTREPFVEIWKVNNIDDDEMGFKGEGYLMEKKE